ncbi:hypothetical protein JYU34_004076 [Plutella xylostella]|uniref:Uncharacterized protein n=1 Tax=Plutella xylostella TaxID=51655 RepID=A0ABQ7QX22_PLUXY|nr:hypothetical protein JYU34_004076 [Plutella xylostella]
MHQIPAEDLEKKWRKKLLEHLRHHYYDIITMLAISDCGQRIRFSYPPTPHPRFSVQVMRVTSVDSSIHIS